NRWVPVSGPHSTASSAASWPHRRSVQPCRPIVGVDRAQSIPGGDGPQPLLRVMFSGKPGYFIKRERVAVNRAAALARTNQPLSRVKYVTSAAIVPDVRRNRVCRMEFPVAGQRFGVEKEETAGA